jgi:phosphatidylserine decarboxylase
MNRYRDVTALSCRRGLYCKNERAVIHARLDDSGADLALLAVGAILVVSMHLNFVNADTSDLRDLFTGKPDFTPYNFQQIQYARTVNPLWLPLTGDIDFSRPVADEVKLHAAIMKSEGLARQKAVPKQ